MTENERKIILNGWTDHRFEIVWYTISNLWDRHFLKGQKYKIRISY